jgi:hypothetical protein
MMPRMKQFLITPSMGKRLIGQALTIHPDIKGVLAKGTLVIIAGTTNGYVAEEVLKSLGQAEGFTREGFRRGMTSARGAKVIQADLPGDVIIRDGHWEKGKTIFDVANDLKAGDVVLKGANAFDRRGQAAVQVANPQGGTIIPTITAAVGRRVRLLVPIGLEKRVFEDVDILARRCNAPDAEGLRLLPIPSEIFTELDAINLMTGAAASLLAAGGVYGAEGAVWLGVTGNDDQVQTASALLNAIADEPPCRV